MLVFEQPATETAVPQIEDIEAIERLEAEEVPVDPRDLEPEALDALSLFLRDMPRGPLLTAAQEWALARRMRGEEVTVPGPGRARPSPTEAHHRLMTENLRLVISVARKFQGRGLPLEDLVQEGVIGLRRAAEKFDPAKGFRFSTYATWWIRQAISRAVLDDVRSVRLPIHMSQRIAQIERARATLRTQLERAPTPDEVGAELGLTGAQVREALQASAITISLDKPMGEDGDSTLGDLIADGGQSPEEQTATQWVADAVSQEILGRLEPRERMVIAMRYGIGRDRPHALDEIGREVGVSRERVRQIEVQALARLRRDPQVRRRFADLAG